MTTDDRDFRLSALGRIAGLEALVTTLIFSWAKNQPNLVKGLVDVLGSVEHYLRQAIVDAGDADDRDAARIALAAFERISAASLAGAVAAADPGPPN